MNRYEKPEIDIELFMSEEILTESGMVFSNNIKIAVPKGKEGTMLILNS